MATVEVPDAARRIMAFARALGIGVDQLAVLLETYDLHLLDGSAPHDKQVPMEQSNDGQLR